MTSTNPVAIMIISGVPFLIPMEHVITENSCIDVHYILPDTTTSPIQMPLPTGTPSMLSIIASDRVEVHFQFTTGSDFFVNSYSIFKTALETLTYYQQEYSQYYVGYKGSEAGKYMFGNPSGAIPVDLKFITYTGRNEYLLYGQIEQIRFSNNSQTNSYDVTITMQRRDFEESGLASHRIKTT